MGPSWPIHLSLLVPLSTTFLVTVHVVNGIIHPSSLPVPYDPGRVVRLVHNVMKRVGLGNGILPPLLSSPPSALASALPPSPSAFPFHFNVNGSILLHLGLDLAVCLSGSLRLRDQGLWVSPYQRILTVLYLRPASSVQYRMAYGHEGRILVLNPLTICFVCWAYS